jgi:hypothetical protein
MGGPLDFLTNIFGSQGAPSPGGDPSVSGENPDWWNKLSSAQKLYFAKNGAQLAAITDSAIGCPKVGPDGRAWQRNSYGWCGPIQAKEPGFLENAGKGFLDFLTGKGRGSAPAGGATPATQVIIKNDSGMPTTAKVAIGVGAVGLVAVAVIAMRKKKS